jgi:hypothetical protein
VEDIVVQQRFGRAESASHAGAGDNMISKYQSVDSDWTWTRSEKLLGGARAQGWRR